MDHSSLSASACETLPMIRMPFIALRGHRGKLVHECYTASCRRAFQSECSIKHAGAQSVPPFLGPEALSGHSLLTMGASAIMHNARYHIQLAFGCGKGALSTKQIHDDGSTPVLFGGVEEEPREGGEW